MIRIGNIKIYCKNQFFVKYSFFVILCDSVNKAQINNKYIFVYATILYNFFTATANHLELFNNNITKYKAPQYLLNDTLPLTSTNNYILRISLRINIFLTVNLVKQGNLDTIKRSSRQAVSRKRNFYNIKTIISRVYVLKYSL